MPTPPAFLAPGPRQPLGGMGDAGSNNVNMAFVASAAHGHIGQLSAAAVLQGVGDVYRRALRPVGGGGVGVAELVSPEALRPYAQLRPFRRHPRKDFCSGSTATTTVRCEVVHGPAGPGDSVMTRSPTW